MSNIADKFEELGVIPVVVLNDSKDALPLAKALVEGGLPCAEVTFRTAAAEESIRLMHEAYPDMVLAAGTVLTTEQVDRAVAAGASVIVSPGFDPEIVDYCISKNIPVMPGIVTPSELAQAVKRGLTRVKFFPATAAGGIKMIKAMCAAYTNVRIMPTGGINTANLEEFLSCDKIFCCGGSWMVKGDLVKAGNKREYGIGMFFFPQDELARNRAKKMFEIIVEKEGLEFLGWREVPTFPNVLGKKAVDCMPYIMQGFVKKPKDVNKGIEFDRKLYVARRVFEQTAEDTYVCSLSSRTIVYKGMFLVGQLRTFF